MGYAEPFMFIVKAKTDDEALEKWLANHKNTGDDIDIYAPLTHTYQDNIKYGMDKVGVFRADTKEGQITLESYRGSLRPKYNVIEITSDKDFDRLDLDDPKLQSNEYFLLPAMLYH